MKLQLPAGRHLDTLGQSFAGLVLRHIFLVLLELFVGSGYELEASP
jgi:hypothetical protein